jgi:HEAT repeat protein
MKVALPISAVLLVLVSSPGAGLLGQQTQDVTGGSINAFHPTEMQAMMASLNMWANRKDFSRPMNLREALSLLMEKAAARGIDLPILVDQQQFDNENPDAKVYDTRIRFSKKSRATTVADLLEETLAHIPNATYLIRRNYVEVTTNQKLVEDNPFASFRITAADMDPREAKGKQNILAIPGGLLDVAAGIAYLTGPWGGIDAMELATGKVLWSSRAVSRPLAIDGNRLVCFSPETMHHSLRLIVLDRRQGKVIQTSARLVFPAWSSVEERWGRQLTLQWCGRHKGNWYLDWEAWSWWDQTSQNDIPARFKKARGIFRISLKDLRIRPARELPPDLYRQDHRDGGFPGGKQRRVELAFGRSRLPGGTLEIAALTGPARQAGPTLGFVSTEEQEPAANVGLPLTAGMKKYGWKVSLGPMRERERRLVRSQHLEVIDVKTGRVLWQRDLEPFFMGLFVEAPGDWRSRGPVSMPALVQELKSKEAARRQIVAERIGQIGPPAKAALPALLDALKDPDDFVRLRAADAVMRIEPHRDALETMRGALKHRDQLVRAMAAESLGLLAGQSGPAVNELCNVLLTDPEPWVRGYAANALGRIRLEPRHALPALAKVLGDADASVRFWAAGSLFRFGRDTRIVLPALSEALKSTDESVRQSVYWSVRWHGDAGLAALCAALQDKKSTYRGEYAEAIGEIQTGTGLSYPTLLPLLWDGEPEVRYQATLALYRLDPERGRDPAIDALCEVLAGIGEDGFRYEHDLLQALARIGPAAKKAVPILCDRGGPWWILGEIGPDARAAIPFLEKALEDEKQCIDAAVALWKITGKAKPSLAVLTKIIENPKERMERRYEAAEAIGELGPQAKAAAPILKKLLSDPWHNLNVAAARALLRIGEHKEESLKIIGQILRDPGWTSIFEYLQKLGPKAKDCLPFLQPLLKSEDPSVRLSAAVAACRIDGDYQKAIPVLTALLRERPELAAQAAERLGEFGSHASAAIPALVECVAGNAADEQDLYLYQAAVLALNKIDAQAAVKAGISLNVRPPRDTLSRPEIAGLWQDLTGHDLLKAYLAQWRLTQSTEAAVPLFAEHLPEVKLVSAEILANLLESLKSDEFRVRQKAHNELSKVGELAEGALRKSLAGKKSLEFARRVQKLLNDLEPDSPRRLRLVRTIQVLEFHHTAQARKLLEKLAEGIPEAWQTQEARLTLERMKKSRKE